jgi:hypothetical protein
VSKFSTQPAEKSEDHLAITYGVAELNERCSYGLKTTTKIGDRQGVLAEVAELRLEEEGTRFLLPKKLVLEIAPRLTCRTLSDHE